jgi:hypothetical protein
VAVVVKTEQPWRPLKQRLRSFMPIRASVIGAHGSNMLLPSGLAGMTIDLMPEDKWQCLPEDILFQEADPRIATFRYRFLPTGSPMDIVAQVAVSMLEQFPNIPPFLTEDSPK